MKVFELRPDVEGYRWISMVNAEDFDVAFEFDGTPIRQAWKPYPVEPIEDDLNEGKPMGDFPTLGTIPTFSQRAVDALLDLLAENGELLPLASEEGKYYAYNVTHVVDALDADRSEVQRFSDGGVMEVVRHEFRLDRIAGQSIFKVPELRVRVFVTEPFVRRVREAGLTGFDFPEVWSAESVGR